MAEEMIERNCPVCSSPSYAFVGEKPAVRLVRCGSCGMIFSNPVTRELVDGSFYEKAGIPFYLSGPKLEGDYSEVRFSRELALFHRFCPSGRVLDVGCSTGGFLYHLRQRYPGKYEVSGTDISTPALDYAASRGVSVIRENFLSKSFPAAGLDAITFWAVLEHVLLPADFLARAAQLLRPGGRCFVLVPNMKSMAVRLLGMRYRYILPQHINYFSGGSLTLLATIYFRLLYLGTSHFNPLVILQDFKSSKGAVSDEDRAHLLQKTNRLKTRKSLRPIRWAYAGTERLLNVIGLGDNLVAVVEKGLP